MRMKKLNLFCLLCFAILESVYTQSSVTTEESIVDLDNDEQQQDVTPQTDDNQENDTTRQQQQQRCRWGEHCPPEEDEDDNSTEQNSSESTSTEPPDTTTSLPTSIKKKNITIIPFIKTTPSKQSLDSIRVGESIPIQQQSDHDDSTTLLDHVPPKGFSISARVYTNDGDSLAHFDFKEQPSLEYWECGAVGSTTMPLVVKHVYFRHALAGADCQVWSGTEYGPHPHLLIPLTKVKVVVSSGSSHVFDSGQVILMEDVLTPGHKLRAVDGANHLEALIVTLPQHYHNHHPSNHNHPSAKMTAFAFGNKKKRHNNNNGNPCPTDGRGALLLVPPNNPVKTKVAFGVMGAVLSSMTALFLTKVAPLWLSVGIGGTCFVVGGTASSIYCGQALVDTIQTFFERKRLQEHYEEQQQQQVKEEKEEE